MPVKHTAGALETHSSYGPNILNYLTADATYLPDER